VVTPLRPILVVEDDHDSRQLLALLLEHQGHSVVTATDGMQALNVAREQRPALILLDLMMPIMSGEEFRRAQLLDTRIRSIPVVVISAHHDAPNIAKRMKVAGYVQKPVDYDALLDLCARTLR
jgi:CheY-like chemotaxis protein